MDDDDGIVLNLDGFDAEEFFAKKKPLAAKRDHKGSQQRPKPDRSLPRKQHRVDSDSDMDGYGEPNGFGVAPLASKPVVLVNRAHKEHAPAAAPAPSSFKFSFLPAGANGNEQLPSADQEPAKPAPAPGAPAVRPFKPAPERERRSGGGPKGQPQGKGPRPNKREQREAPAQREVGPEARERHHMAAEDAEDELEKAEIDRDGLDTILSLVQRTAQRDAAVEAVRTGAAAPPPAKRAKRDEPRPEGEDEAGAFVSFAGGFRSSGAQVKRPSQKVQAALRKKFGGNETDEEDDGLLHIREQERTALAAEDSGPAEDAFEFDSDPDSDSDYDANAQAHGTYDSEDSDGIGAVYGRNPAVGAPSTSGRALALEAQERRKKDLKDQKKAKKKATAAAAGTKVAHRAGELVHAGPMVKGEAGNEVFGTATEAAEGEESDPWRQLGLADTVARHLKDLHFVAPTKIQQLAIPGLLSGRDSLVNAPTGSGKTLAYLAPIVQDLQSLSARVSRGEGTYAIVVAPTRELAIQIGDVLTLLLRRFHWIVGGSIMGGENRGKEKSRLRKGVSVLVASPGRLLDHLEATQAFRTDHLRWLVLDEADRLLDLGFEAKLQEIVQLLDKRKAAGPDRAFRYRRVLLSATLHSRLSQLASVSLQAPVAIGFKTSRGADGQLAIARAEDDADAAPTGKPGDMLAVPIADDRHDTEEGTFRIPKQLRQSFVQVPAKQRLAALVGFLRAQERKPGAGASPPKIVVFMSSCDGVEFHHKLIAGMPVRLPKVMKRGHPNQDRLQDDADDFDADLDGDTPTLLSLPVFKLHGNMIQSQRTSTFFDFARCTSGVLLCTDVAARGLDFPAVTTIVQFDPPGEPSEYVHRVGRTARLGQKGESLLFLMPSEADYADLLRGNGVSIGEERADPYLRHLPASKVKAPVPGAKRGREEYATGSTSGLVADFQFRVTKFVHTDKDLQRLASDAFRSYVRAYAVHPASVRSIFHVKKLHLGHVAGSFGLKETPSLLGASAAKEEAQKRRRDDELEKKKKAQKKGRMVGQARDEYNIAPASKGSKSGPGAAGKSFMGRVG